VEIAKSYGARVLHSKWRNDFSYHRNEAIAAAKGLWIFICDADEVVVDTDVNETRFHLEHSPLNPILMATQRLLYPDGKKINMLAPRIFRSDLNIRYTYPIHEQLDVDETSATLSNVTLLHRGYEDEETLEAKERRNLEIAMTMEDSPHASHCRARAALSLRDWQKVVEAAHGLTGDKVPTAVCVEGCVLGAAASFNLSNRDDFNLFLEAARKRVPDSPDVRFMELILAGQKYLESLSTVLTISSSR
jgi:glycosyltransferase involved in cell wall biosynthesis